MYKVHTLVFLFGCGGGHGLTGEWLGTCEAGDSAIDVRAVLYGDEPTDDEPYAYEAQVVRSDAEAGEVGYRCHEIDEVADEAWVQGCRTSDTDQPSDLSWRGPIDREEPVDTWRGTCTHDGAAGDVTLWRLP